MDFDSDQLQVFLDQIASDEARQLESLESEYALESSRIRHEAREESRIFHHRAAQEARSRMVSDHHRKLSRARSEFRRRRWQKLEELQLQAGDAILRRLQQRWAEQGDQLVWCRYWLDVCEALEGATALELRVSRDIHPTNLEVLQELSTAAHPQSLVVVDEKQGQGILVSRGLFVVDGLLRTQLRTLLELASRDLAQWVHGSQPLAGRDA